MHTLININTYLGNCTDDDGWNWMKFGWMDWLDVGPLEMYVYVCINTFKCVLICVYVYKTHLKFSTRSNHQLYLYIFVPFFMSFTFVAVVVGLW